MKKLNRVPVATFWFFPMIAIDTELKEIYFGWLWIAYACRYEIFID